MTSWQSGNAVSPKSKATMLAALVARDGRHPAQSKLAGRNTLDYTDALGVRRIRLHETDVLTIGKPRGGFTIDTGGYNTSTTRSRLNENLPNGWRVYTQRGVLHLWQPRTSVTTIPFRQRVTVDAKGKARADVTPETLAKELRQIDAYMARWKEAGLPIANESGGDPWVTTTGKVERSVMLDWTKSKYVFRRLYAMALTFAGVTDEGVAHRMYSADRRGLDRYDLGRIRRYVRACLGGAA